MARLAEWNRLMPPDHKPPSPIQRFRARMRTQKFRAAECPNCGGSLVDGACAFCPPDLDEERDREFAELDSFFRPERAD